jgi:hypothetical protein
MKINGKEITGDKKVANAFTTHYKQISSMQTNNKQQNKNDLEIYDQRIFSEDFSLQELNSAIWKIRNKKKTRT